MTKDEKAKARFFQQIKEWQSEKKEIFDHKGNPRGLVKPKSFRSGTKTQRYDMEDFTWKSKTPRQQYFDKYKLPQWGAKRLRILKRDYFECYICDDSDSVLEVHHKYYFYDRDPSWDYPDDALITLCEKCHKKEHKIFDKYAPDYYNTRDGRLESILNKLNDDFLLMDLEKFEELLDNITKLKDRRYIVPHLNWSIENELESEQTEEVCQIT